MDTKMNKFLCKFVLSVIDDRFDINTRDWELLYEAADDIRRSWLGLPDRSNRYPSFVFDRMWEFEKFWPLIEKCFPGITSLELICMNYMSRSDGEPCTFEGIPSSVKHLRWIYGIQTRDMSLKGLHSLEWLEYARSDRIYIRIPTQK